MRPLSIAQLKKIEWALAEAMAVLKRQGFQNDEVALGGISLGAGIMKEEMGASKCAEYLRKLAAEVEKEGLKN